MIRATVAHPAGLLFPGGVAVAAQGQEVQVDIEHPAIKGWIEAGYLTVKAEPKKPATKPGK